MYGTKAKFKFDINYEFKSIPSSLGLSDDPTGLVPSGIIGNGLESDPLLATVSEREIKFEAMGSSF